MSRTLTSFVFAVAACAPAFAQGGGFTAGDLYLLSPSVTGGSSTDGALVHVDLSAGTATILVDTFITPSLQGSVAFDPYRERIVFYASVNSVGNPTHMWCADAAGALTDAGLAVGSYASLAPTGDGRIYMHDFGGFSTSHPFVYLDVAGALNTLMDASGAAPFSVDGNPNFDVRGMIFDAGTNALFIASTNGGACMGGAADKINVHKLPLSADGTRVAGPVTCAQFEVSSSGETPSGWSHGPAGQLVLVVDTNSNAQEPRMLLVDPATLAISAFASNGSYTGAAATNAGSWCSTLGKTVILDTLSDNLRSFGAGEVGNGTILGLVGPVSSAGGSGEGATLVQVEPSACAGGWIPYGQGFPGKGGFVPRLYGVGCDKIGGSFGLTIDRAVGSATASLFVGLAKASVPFKGGTFLVGSVALNAVIGLGGPPGVAGAGALTLPASLPNNPLLQGVSVFLQAGFHDPAAVKGVSLTQGVEMEIG